MICIYFFRSHLLDDLHRRNRSSLLRQFLLRSIMFPEITRTDLLLRLFESNPDSDMMFMRALHEFNKTNDIPTRPRLNRVTVQCRDYSEQELYDKFRFNHEEFQQLLTELRVPDRIRFQSWSFSGEEALLILLRRMGSVITFTSMRSEFRRDECELCACFNGMIVWLVNHHGWLIQGG